MARARSNVGLWLVSAVMVTSVVVAQSRDRPVSADQSTVIGCAHQYQAAMEATERANHMLDDAERSGDPAARRALVERARSMVTQIKREWAACAVVPGTVQYAASTQSQTMSGDDVIRQCLEHCRTASKQMNDVTNKINDARTSSDVAEVAGAFDDTQKPLTEMKAHMDQCMSMMDMMQKMGGMMKR